MTDGRDELLDQTIKSFDAMVSGPVTERVIFDDTGSVIHTAELIERHPDYAVISNGRRNGFGEAVRLAWQHVSMRTVGRFVFHLEDDFTFARAVDLWSMAETLDRHRYLAQMALRRQACNDHEVQMGGVVETHPLEYVERWGDYPGPASAWLEHRLFWTTNPSLFRREMLDAGWQGGDQAEGRFTHLLLAEGIDAANWAEVRFAYWGARDSGVWVNHEGARRNGHGY
jgi:hypothetical protein